MRFDETLSQVRATMEDVFDIDDLQVTPQTTADDVEEWDSLSHIRLIVALERKFKIRFKTAEIEGLENVGDLVQLIGTKIT
jgi:acyl carrier protein